MREVGPDLATRCTIMLLLLLLCCYVCFCLGLCFSVTDGAAWWLGSLQNGSRSISESYSGIAPHFNVFIGLCFCVRISRECMNVCNMFVVVSSISQRPSALDAYTFTR